MHLLPNDKALARVDRLGVFDHLIDKCNEGFKEKGEDEFHAKIVCPLSDANLNIVNQIKPDYKRWIELKRLTGEYSFVDKIGDDSKSLYIPILELEKSSFNFPL